MMIFGIIFSLLTGKASAFTDGLMDSSTEAVSFILSLAGIMAAWSGPYENSRRIRSHFQDLKSS